MSKRKSKQRQIKKHNARIIRLWGHDALYVTSVLEISREDLPPDVLNKAPDATGAIEITSEVHFFEGDDGPPIYAPDGTKIVY